MDVYGSTTCPAGFASDYTGYVMADHHTHYRRQWLCVDKDAEATGSTGNENGALL